MLDRLAESPHQSQIMPADMLSFPLRCAPADWVRAWTARASLATISLKSQEQGHRFEHNVELQCVLGFQRC